MKSKKSNLRLTPAEVRRFVRRNIGRRVIVVLFTGEVLVGRILSSGLISFRLRVQRRGFFFIRRIQFAAVVAIRLV